MVAGHVGHGASAAALTLLGHEVWQIPTVTLSGHAAVPGVQGRRSEADEVLALGRGLQAAGRLQQVDAVLLGYLGSAGVGRAAAEILRMIPPAALVVCDPVLGDAGRLYLPAEMIGVYTEHLLPLADVVTPNIDELGWLSGGTASGIGAAAAQLRALGPKAVCVTSFRDSAGLGLAYCTETAMQCATAADSGHHINGAGDFVAALVLAGHLAGRSGADIAARVVAATSALAQLSAAQGRDDLPVSAEAEAWLAAFAGRSQPG